MATYKEALEELIGDTPVLRLARRFPDHRVFAKLEYYNPTFSSKDRVAAILLQNAIRDRKVRAGDIVVVATSGNTGYGLCLVARRFKLSVVCVVPSDVKPQKQLMLAANGARVVTCDSKYKSDEPGGYAWTAVRLAAALPNAYLLDQFGDPANCEAQYKTGMELIRQMDGRIDYLFCPIGTGGTITGIGRCLKEHNPATTIVAVDPVGGIYRGAHAGRETVYREHIVDGISDDYVSPIVDLSLIDEVVEVDGRLAYSACHSLLATEQLCVGPSSGIVTAAIAEFIKRDTSLAKAHLLTTFPDTGLRYTDSLYNAEFLSKHGIPPFSTPQLSPESEFVIRRVLADEGSRRVGVAV